MSHFYQPFEDHHVREMVDTMACSGTLDVKNNKDDVLQIQGMFTQGITIQTREYCQGKYTTDDDWVGTLLASSGLIRYGSPYFNKTKTFFFGRKMEFTFQEYATGGRGNEANSLTYEEYSEILRKDLSIFNFWKRSDQIPDHCLVQQGNGQSLGNRMLKNSDFITHKDCTPTSNRERHMVFAGLKNKNKDEQATKLEDID